MKFLDLSKITLLVLIIFQFALSFDLVYMPNRQRSIDSKGFSFTAYAVDKKAIERNEILLGQESADKTLNRRRKAISTRIQAINTLLIPKKKHNLKGDGGIVKARNITMRIGHSRNSLNDGYGARNNTAGGNVRKGQKRKVSKTSTERTGSNNQTESVEPKNNKRKNLARNPLKSGTVLGEFTILQNSTLEVDYLNGTKNWLTFDSTEGPIRMVTRIANDMLRDKGLETMQYTRNYKETMYEVDAKSGDLSRTKKDLRDEDEIRKENETSKWNETEFGKSAEDDDGKTNKNKGY